MDWDLTIAAISMLAGIAGAWFAFIAVRGQVRHRRAAGDPVSQPPAGGAYDAFISYGADDEAKAEWLARGLLARGLRVFLAKWIDIGLVEYAEKERALGTTTNGILLFSRTTMTQPEVRDDYAALLQRIHTGGRRFIPVLIDAVELPAFAKIRKSLDLTNSHDNDANLDTLAHAIRLQSSN